jgi:hypothetical protein
MAQGVEWAFGIPIRTCRTDFALIRSEFEVYGHGSLRPIAWTVLCHLGYSSADARIQRVVSQRSYGE